MGFLSKFEGKMEDTIEGAAELFSGSSISPVQIAKKAEKQMRRERVVGAGKQYAPTLYTVLVSPQDDAEMSNYYPTLAGETETYLLAKAAEVGYDLDCQPLVRFIIDDQLKHGKFDIVAEMVAAPIIANLRAEEMARYGIASPNASHMQSARGQGGFVTPANVAQSPRANVSPSGMPLGGGYAAQGAVQSASAYGNASGKDAFELGYDSDFDEINSANIAEPPSGMADAPITTLPFDQQQNMQQGMNMPMQGMPQALHEVYLYDASRDRAYQLSGAPQKIGRESSNDINIPDINASRVHAEIRMEPTGSWIITDLQSMNGLYVNGHKVKTSPLRDADIITIGTTELEFQLLE